MEYVSNVIFMLITSPQARFTPFPTPAFPTPSHSLFRFLITPNGAENYQNLKILTIQGEN